MNQRIKKNTHTHTKKNPEFRCNNIDTDMKRAAMVMMMSGPEIQTYNISGTQPTHTHAHNVIMLLDEFIRKQKKKKNSRTLK